MLKYIILTSTLINCPIVYPIELRIVSNFGVKTNNDTRTNPYDNFNVLDTDDYLNFGVETKISKNVLQLNIEFNETNRSSSYPRINADGKQINSNLMIHWEMLKREQWFGFEMGLKNSLIFDETKWGADSCGVVVFAHPSCSDKYAEGKDNISLFQIGPSLRFVFFGYVYLMTSIQYSVSISESRKVTDINDFTINEIDVLKGVNPSSEIGVRIPVYRKSIIKE